MVASSTVGIDNIVSSYIHTTGIERLNRFPSRCYEYFNILMREKTTDIFHCPLGDARINF